MQTGLGILRLAPADFWQMTPKELAAAVAATNGESPASCLERAEFDELFNRYPDEVTHG